MISTRQFFIGILILASCSKTKNEEQISKKQNQLIVTVEGDTLENGFWILNTRTNGVKKNGNYENGYKIGKWNYQTRTDSLSINWNVIDQSGVTFNIPSHFVKVDKIELPLLFQADVADDDNSTYLALLRYDLDSLKSSIYDYVYQYNNSLTNTKDSLIWKEFKKFSFQGVDIFRARVKTERRQTTYEAISYIFVVNNFLYDLTYKNNVAGIDAIDLEIFDEILYSIKCENVDLFNFNNQKFLKEENIDFK